MKTFLQPLPQPQRLILIEEDREKLEKLFQSHWEAVKDTIEVPGFEKGQVVQTLAEKKLGPEKLYRPIIDKLVAEGLSTAQINFVDIEAVSIEWQTEKTPLVIYVRGYLPPKVLDCDYKTIVSTHKKLLVTEAEIDSLLLRTAASEAEETEHEQVPEGDLDVVVVVDFIMDDVEKERIIANQPDIRVFLSKPVYGFEKDLIGKNIDDVFTTELTLPDDFIAKQFAGKKVSYQIKIKKIYKLDIPKLTDELAVKVGYSSLEDMREKIRKDLEKEKEKADEMLSKDHIMALLVAKTNYTPIPEGVISQELQTMLSNVVKQTNKMQGLQSTEEEYLAQAKITKEEWFNRNWDLAEKKVKGNLALLYIAEQEGIAPTEQECEEAFTKLLPEGAVPDKSKINPEGLKFYVTLLKAQERLLEIVEQNKQTAE